MKEGREDEVVPSCKDAKRSEFWYLREGVRGNEEERRVSGLYEVSRALRGEREGWSHTGGRDGLDSG